MQLQGLGIAHSRMYVRWSAVLSVDTRVFPTSDSLETASVLKLSLQPRPGLEAPKRREIHLERASCTAAHLSLSLLYDKVLTLPSSEEECSSRERVISYLLIVFGVNVIFPRHPQHAAKDFRNFLPHMSLEHHHRESEEYIVLSIISRNGYRQPSWRHAPKVAQEAHKALKAHSPSHAPALQVRSELRPAFHLEKLQRLSLSTSTSWKEGEEMQQREKVLAVKLIRDGWETGVGLMSDEFPSSLFLASIVFYMHPGRSGTGFLPRFGGGWMHQFGNVYALQQELLNPNAQHWFRALELWHTAREEGVALNTSHYTNMLRQCVQPRAWEAALLILNQMKKENIRPDVAGISCALVTCVEAKQANHAEKLFQHFSQTVLLDSICYLALVRAQMMKNDPDSSKKAIEAGKAQAAARVPFARDALELLLEACCNVPGEEPFAEVLVHHLEAFHSSPSSLPSLPTLKALKNLSRSSNPIAAYLEKLQTSPLCGMIFRVVEKKNNNSNCD
eukprot:gene3805-2691_t